MRVSTVHAVIGRSIGVVTGLLLTMSGVVTTHASQMPPDEIRIRLHVDPSLRSRRLAERLKTETEAIWEPYGVRIEWTSDDLSESTPDGLFLDARLEREFDGRAKWPEVLGRAFPTPEPPWRPIHVSFDATARVLALRTNAPPWTKAGAVPDPEIAPALGRVLAHEIGHLLLGPEHHLAGLMRASFRPDELWDADRTPFRLTCTTVKRLRDRLRALRGRLQVVHPSVEASCIA